MKMSLLIGLLVLALSGGYVAAEKNAENENTSGSPTNTLEAPAADHAKFCTKSMGKESDDVASKAPMNNKEHDSTDSKGPHKHI